MLGYFIVSQRVNDVLQFKCSQCGILAESPGANPGLCRHCGEPLGLPGPPNRPDRSEVDADTTIPPRGIAYVADTELPTITGYDIIREIGSGGMGRVFEARDQQLGRMVALKILSDPLSHREPEALQRFLQEGRLAARISHPRSTFVYEAGFDRQRPYIVMELMPGRTLKDELNEAGKLTIQRAVDVTLDIIDGLAAAHELGVVHRDVKPANCFVEPGGRVKIGDFGLSKSLLGDVETTQMGSFMGTPCFASPEQIRGERVDERTDIYSLGATLYTLLAGRPPFTGDSIAVAAQIVSDPPPPLRKLSPNVPKQLEEIVLRAMEKRPEDRYPSMDTMRMALLPFASRGTSLAEIGRRVAAFMIDFGAVQVVVQTLVLLIALLWVTLGNMQGSSEKGDQLMRHLAILTMWQNLVGWLASLGLFAVGDGLWGRTPGKWLMSLRVVNLQGEHPGLWRGLLRAIVIPGAFGLPLVSMLSSHFWTVPQEFHIDDYEFQVWIFNILPLALVGLIGMLTMRESNKLRGIHEWLSDTQTIALPIARKQYHPAIKGLPFETLAEPYFLGRFKIIGRLPTNRDGTGIFLGHDEVLDRRALVFCSREHSASNIVGFQVNRPTRSRWLQGGNDGDMRWDAFESFGGVPFSYLTNRVTNLSWGMIKSAIFDLVREILATLQDKTLPKQLTFDNFMVTREGRGRLIDLPVNVFDPTRFITVSKQPDQDDLTRSMKFLRDVLDWAYVHLLMPNTANEMVNEFRVRDNSMETLKWLRDRLDQENRRVSEMTWDSRLGALAFSTAIEWTVIAGLTSLLSWFVLSYIGYFPLWKPMWCWLVALLGIYIIGGVTRGGPAFKLMGVEIRGNKGELASASQCGLRNVLSWMGICTTAVASTFFFELGNDRLQGPQRQSVAMSAAADSMTPAASETAASGDSADVNGLSDKETTQVLVMIAVVIVGTFVTLVGAAFAIYSPRRGIPDWILGTQLVPR